MRTTIDKAGRVVVPAEMRQRLGLTDRAEVDIDENDGVIEIGPAPVRASVVRSEHGAVIRASQPVDELTDEDVRRTLDQIRR